MLTRTEINLIAEKTAELVIAKTDELMTAKACADWLEISVKALYKRCETGRIPSHKKHGTVYFYKNEIQNYYKTDKPAS